VISKLPGWLKEELLARGAAAPNGTTDVRTVDSIRTVVRLNNVIVFFIFLLYLFFRRKLLAQSYDYNSVLEGRHILERNIPSGIGQARD
jgi:hypothetical protein